VAGKYLLERVLGEGGMGSVWLAHNMDLDAPVAIKLLGSEGAPREAADRLKREARAEARLEHRAIVRVFDCGETEHGDPFIVMERLEGKSFADALEETGPISAVSAVRILLPIIDGLSAAHDEGIVHRDIKPENIFLAQCTRYLQPKVVDFGIAKLDRWDPNPGITIQGTVIGSPSYMSPEQARGLSDVDQRSDIWAVCAVLYEALTGSAPFRGDTYNAILRSIVEDEVTPLTNCGGDEAELWTLLERGFAKDRANRFQTMRELGTALAQFLVWHGVTDDVCGDPLAATWDVPVEPRDDTSPRGALSSAVLLVSPNAEALTRAPLGAPPVRAPIARSVALTSTSGVATPSGVVRAQRRSVLLPSIAAVVLLGAVATSIWKWSEVAPTTATASLALVAAPPVPRAGDRVPPVAPAPAPAPTPSSAAIAPIVMKAPVSRPQDRPKSASRTSRHGWPTVTNPMKGHASLPGDVSGRAQTDPAINDATLNALGLKAPYR
jgi:serine/threonine-protein kinase